MVGYLPIVKAQGGGARPPVRLVVAGHVFRRGPMARLFPHPQDKYPVVHTEDTDLDLPSHVRNADMRYS